MIKLIYSIVLKDESTKEILPFQDSRRHFFLTSENLIKIFMRRTISSIVAISREFLFLHILKMQFIKILLIESKNFNNENWIFKYTIL